MATINLPSTPVTIFIMGPLMVMFAGFWTGGVHGASARQQEDQAVFARGAAPTKAVVTSCYNTDSNRYSVNYDFMLDSGLIYAGEYQSSEPISEGQKVPVLYAKADPSINHPPAHSEGADFPVPGEYIGVGFAALIMTVMAFLGLKRMGSNGTVITLFLLLCSAFFLLGLPLGGLIHDDRYTVQVGDEAFASPSFNNWHPGGVDFKINGGVLTYGGQKYPLAHHAHVWLQDGQVSITVPTQ